MAIDLSAQELQLVKDILSKLLPGVEVWVFGSRISGKPKPYSDLDLVLRAAAALPTERLAELAEAFDASNLSFRVDLIDWHRIGPEFQKIILDKHELLSPAN